MTITHGWTTAEADDPTADVSQRNLNDHSGNGLGVFNADDYGLVANGVADDGPAISAAIAAASAVADDYTQATVLIRGDCRIKTSIIVKPNVRVDMREALLTGPIDGALVISAPTAAAADDDIDAQTEGGCFTDDAAGTANVIGLSFVGGLLRGFRYGFVSKCLSWPQVTWTDMNFENCNIGIFCYQGAIDHRLVNVRSIGVAAGTTYVAVATCYAAAHPYADAVVDNFFCDGFTYEGTTFDGSVVNVDFDDWFEDSILRPTTASETLNGSLTFDFTGSALRVSGRNIYIPSRNKRSIYLPVIHRASGYGCDRGVALVANPIRADFWQIAGENLFAAGPEAMVTILLSGNGMTGSFEHIDGVNVTNPSSAAVEVVEEPGSALLPAQFTAPGDILGGVIGYARHFVDFGVAPLDLWVGPLDPRLFTQSGTFAANFVWATKFQVSHPVTVSAGNLYVAVQDGTVDIGIFSQAGVRLASTGPTACPAVGEATISLTAPVTLLPGVPYWSCIAFSSGTTSIGKMTAVYRANINGYVGIGSATLPASGLAIPPTADYSSPLIVFT